MSMNDWKLSRDNEDLAQILSFVPGIEQTKVISKALSGAVYIQTIGDGTKWASVSIFASRDEMGGVNEAEADGAVVVATYRDKRYIGYIEEAPEWETVLPGSWYRTNIKLLIEEDVSL